MSGKITGSLTAVEYGEVALYIVGIHAGYRGLSLTLTSDEDNGEVSVLLTPYEAREIAIDLLKFAQAIDDHNEDVQHEAERETYETELATAEGGAA